MSVIGTRSEMTLVCNTELAEQERYWQRKFAGGLPMLELPLDRPRPLNPTLTRATVSAHLDDALARELEVLGADRSLSTVILAGLVAMLQRYCSADSIAIGMTVVLEDGGPNLVLVPSEAGGNPTFHELLSRVSGAVEDAHANREYPFDDLCAWLRRREPAASVAPRVVFVPADTELSLYALSTEADLVVSATRQIDGALIECIYQAEMFESDTIRQFTAQLHTFLKEVALDPEQPIGRVPILSEAERDRLVRLWNSTEVDVDFNADVAAQFEARANQHPLSTAVSSGGVSASYAELNARANRVAHHLRALGIGPDAIVGVCVERSIDMLVALLGVLKSGAGYLPLDPGYPSARLKLILEDSQAAILVTSSGVQDLLPEHVPQVRLDTDRVAINSEPSDNPKRTVSGEHLAYVIYTSGSTGIPKGVAVTRANVANLFVALDDRFGTEPGVWLAVTSMSFDISVVELFWTLCRGFHVVLESREGATGIADAVARHGVSHMQCTPSHAQLLSREPESLAALRSLKLLILGGEPLSPSLARLITTDSGVRLVNAYGPTETTVYSTSHLVSDITEPVIPIGRPLANTQVYLLEESGNLVPRGAAGEVHIGGRGVARGYLNRPDLTAARFVPDPFSVDPNGRLYRTGDRARYRSDGTLEFLGRLDNQIKLRGFRIEIGEVESAIRRHPGVEDAAVAVRNFGEDDDRLVAYVVGTVTGESLTTWLESQLPKCMVPFITVLVPDLPRHPNGKLNRNTLSSLELTHRPITESDAPRNETQRRLASIWERLLGFSPIGIHDDFFGLGGHSLLAARLLTVVRQEFQRAPSLARLFPSVTIENLARMLDSELPEPDVPGLVAIQPASSGVALFCIHGLGGGVADFANLARHLGPLQAVYGIEADRQAIQNDPTTIEAMAERCIQIMKRVRPNPPYALLGHSFGGVLAFEIARQLEAAGDAVGLLLLLDAAAPFSRYYKAMWNIQWVGRFLNNLPHWIADFYLLGARGGVSRIRRVTRKMALDVWQKLGLPIGKADEFQVQHVLDDVPEVDSSVLDLMQMQLVAEAAYKPRSSAGPMFLLRARRQPLLCSFDPTMGWGELAGQDVSLIVLPGNHVQMLFEPEVGVMGKHVRQLLEQISA